MTKLIIKILIFFILILNFSFANEIKKITVIGNERISKDTIILFSELKANDKITNELLNNSIKKLYSTNYFEIIEIEYTSQEVIIKVKENKIIQSIQVKGIKNKTIKSSVEEMLLKYEKTSYLSEKILNLKNEILNKLQSDGFYFAKVNPLINDYSDNNAVDIVYDIFLGERAIIEEINFVGNKKIKDRKLRNVIVSEEGKFWKFLTRNKYLDVKRIELDKRLLTNYYKNKGFYNVRVESTFAKIYNNENFSLNFKINSGEKFFFNEIKFDIPDDYSSENFDIFTKIFQDLNGQRYSLSSIDKIIKEINKIALIEEFEFIDASYKEEIVDKNKINLSITFDESEKLYVERINVYGNFITEEKVIRNSFIIDEGDPFNELLFEKSIANLKAKNIFETVNNEIIDSKSSQNSKIINITVEEKPTGEIFAGLGAGTDGTSLSAGIKENNYLGKGIKLNSSLSLSGNKVKGIFQATNPNFRNSDRSVSTTIESSSLDYMTLSGYKSSRTGFSLGSSYEQYDDLFLSPKVSTYYETIDTSSKASSSKKKQEGDYFETLFSYGLTVNKLNQNFQPSEGFKSSFRQTLPIYSSDDITIEHYFDISRYYTYADDLVFSVKFYAEAVNALDKDVRISKRVFVPSRKLRGFTAGKIGPQDAGEYIGGNYGSALNLTSDLPIFNEYQSVDFNIFFDAANVWGVDYSKLLDDSKLRSSTGIGVDWFTPIGPLTFSLALPLTKEHTDETETVRFNIGTSF